MLTGYPTAWSRASESIVLFNPAVSLGHYAVPQVLGQRSEPALGLPAANPSWPDRTVHWAQLTLVENDPESFDLEF